MLTNKTQQEFEVSRLGKLISWLATRKQNKTIPLYDDILVFEKMQRELTLQRTMLYYAGNY